MTGKPLITYKDMNKKMYQQPRLRIVNLHCKQLLESASPAHSVVGKVQSGDTGLTGAGTDRAITGGGGTARGREYDCWGDEEEE